MANDYVEEFSIGFGFDLKNLKKQTTQIEKIFDNLLAKQAKIGRLPPLKPIAPPKTPKTPKRTISDQDVIDKAIEARQKRELKRAQDILKVRKADEKVARDVNKVIDARIAKEKELARKRELLRSGALYGQAKGGLGSGFEGRLNSARSKEDFAALNREMRGVSRAASNLNRNMVGLNIVQRGLNDSTRNMVRRYASLFAIFEGTAAIKKVGMEFDSLRASMLVVSDSEEDAVEKMAFVRKEAVRLGIDLHSASKAFLGLSASAGDALGEQGVRKLFTSVLGISKAFGMSVDDTKGTFRAFTQMLSKGNVQAEELRGQLGERLFGAFNLASEAMGKTTKQMNKALEMGQVTAKDLLPKLIPLMDKLATKNGALEKQMESAQTAQNRMIISAQEAGDEIWKGGFGEGIKVLFNTINESLTNATPELKKLGYIFGEFFKVLSTALKVLTPILKVFVNNFEIFAALFLGNKLSGAMGAVLFKIKAINRAVNMGKFTMMGFAAASAKAWTIALAPLAAVLAALTAISEMAALADDNTIGLIEASRGYQVIGGRKMQVVEQGGKFYQTGVDLGVSETARAQRFNTGANMGMGAGLSTMISHNVEVNVKGDISTSQLNKVKDELSVSVNNAIIGSTKEASK